jgi:hypothetical protein
MRIARTAWRQPGRGREEKLGDHKREKAIDGEVEKLEQVTDNRGNHDLALRNSFSGLNCND